MIVNLKEQDGVPVPMKFDMERKKLRLPENLNEKMETMLSVNALTEKLRETRIGMGDYLSKLC